MAVAGAVVVLVFVSSRPTLASDALSGNEACSTLEWVLASAPDFWNKSRSCVGIVPSITSFPDSVDDPVSGSRAKEAKSWIESLANNPNGMILWVVVLLMESSRRMGSVSRSRETAIDKSRLVHSTFPN